MNSSNASVTPAFLVGSPLERTENSPRVGSQDTGFELERLSSLAFGASTLPLRLA